MSLSGARVKALGAVRSMLHMRGKVTPIDPLLLFQRISLLKKSNEELIDYLHYELAPFPSTIFTDTGMRKRTKSALFKSAEHPSSTHLNQEQVFM